MKSRRMSFRTSENVKSALENVARERKGTVSGVIHDAITSFLQNGQSVGQKKVIEDIKDDIVPHYNHPLISAMRNEGLVFYDNDGEVITKVNTIKELFDFLIQNRD